ncbi:vacuolar protein-sorting-associated protein 25 [Neocloeon triangulifer]|uniref:vacuolar protein-sorting-associated protein 25 n=1 Tax=Neocloeon triangulifer TaxID=2078957 RepID=UPI00286EC6DD|nr:vacuolar protein-sorting-associated protein 25 [Neocloeon triangulifer]
MTGSGMEWPWQYDFPPFFTIQPHSETRAKQLLAWRSLVLDYFKQTKESVLDVREVQNTPLFFNSKINRKLPQEGVMMILADLQTTGNAEPLDKTKNRWLIFWRTPEEWGKLLYNWAQSRGMTNSVCTLFELVAGDDTTDEEFYGLDMDVVVKAIRTLEMEKKAEIMMFDDSHGVKFF